MVSSPAGSIWPARSSQQKQPCPGNTAVVVSLSGEQLCHALLLLLLLLTLLLLLLPRSSCRPAAHRSRRLIHSAVLPVRAAALQS